MERVGLMLRVVGRAGLALLGDDFATGEPQGVLRVELHEGRHFLGTDAGALVVANRSPAGAADVRRSHQLIQAGDVDESSDPIVY